MKRCALLTCEDLSGYVTDEHHFEQALEEAGWHYEWVEWKRDGVDWSEYDCAIVRTTWDYTRELQLFLEKMQIIEDSNCPLYNDYSLIKWNSDKGYLKDLSEQGVQVIPTLWETYQNITQITLAFQKLEVDQLVIKPRVSAGAKDTFLVSHSDLSKSGDFLKVLLGREIMIQPFLKQVAEEGEYSAFYFNGELSHVILKKPKHGDFRSQEEFGSNIKLIEPSGVQKGFCQSVLGKLSKPYLFARVDFINDKNSQANLIELELIEPSLYFRYKEDAAAKLVQALEQLV